MNKKTIYTLTTLMIPFFVSAHNKNTSFKEIMDFEVALDAPYDENAPYLEKAFVHDSSQLILELSDGSQWLIRNKDVEDGMHDISGEWLKGDQVRIKPRDPIINSGKFLLKNVRNNKAFFADIFRTTANKEAGKKITKIDKNGYTIVTEDDKTWSVGWFGSFTANKWQPGDHVIFNKSNYSREEDYLLINLDNGAHTWASLTAWK